MAFTKITGPGINTTTNVRVGIITASNFKSGTSNVHDVGIEIAGINVLGADTPIGAGATIYNTGGADFTGIVTATTIDCRTLLGSVSIGGTLTYEDVKNVDSIGIVTARTGIKVLAGGINAVGVVTATSFDGDISGTPTLGTGVTVTSSGMNVTGVVTATSFKGDGSALTGIDATALKDSGGNVKIQANGAGAVVTGVLTSTTFKGALTGNVVGNVTGNVTGTASDASGATGDFSIADKIIHTGDTNTAIRFPGADIITAETAGNERLRIDASGNTLVNVNTATAGSYTYKLLSSDNIGSSEQTFGIQYPSVVTYGLNAESNADFTIKKDGTQRLRIVSGGAFLLGEATSASNAEQFRIHTADSGKAIIKFTNSGTGSAAGDGFEFGLNASEHVELWHKENHPMYFATNNTERLRIAADGKLLVGKNSAYGSAIAQVHNTSQYVLDLNLWSADANAGVLAFYKSRNATPGGATIVQDDDGIASLRFLGNDGANSREAGYIKAFVDGTPGTDDMPGRIVFGTTADGAPSATERLRIASTGQVLLGTTTPSGYSNRILTVAAADNDSGIEIRTATDHGGQISFSDGSAADATNYRGYIRYDHDGDYMRLGTSSTERLRIDSAGDVGVNITDPIAQLQVNSTRNAKTDRHSAANYHLALRNPADDNNEAIGLSFGITSNATKVGAAILHERDAGGSQGSLQFYTSSDGNSLSERLRIGSAGQFGIGGANWGSSGQVLTSGGASGAVSWASPAAATGLLNSGEVDITSSGGAVDINAAHGVTIDSGYWTKITPSYYFQVDSSQKIELNAGYGFLATGGASTGWPFKTQFQQYELYHNNGTDRMGFWAYLGGNTALGYRALQNISNVHAGNNTAIGFNAGESYTSGSGNVAIGMDAHDSNQTGGENTIVGHQAAQANTSNRNTCLGNSALYSNITGYNNVAIGRYAMMLAGGGTNINACTAIGHNAMYTGGGDGNTVIGSEAGYSLTTGHSNTVLGGSAFDANQAGHYTVAIGNNCLGNFNNAQSENTAIGSQCATALTSGNENVFIGRECATGITGGAYNVVIGKSAMAGSTGSNVHSNVVIGRTAGRLITGAGNVCVGNQSGYSLTGAQNVIIGNEASYHMTSGGHNVHIGYRAGHGNALTSSHNVFIGHEACKGVHINSGSIVAIGSYALDNYDGYGGGSYGGWTVAIGPAAMGANRNTRHSVAIGNAAGNVWNPSEGNLHEGGCVFIGGSAGGDGATTATAAVVIGRNAYASGNNKTGANNVAIGTRALEQCQGGQHNVCMGTFAGYRITSGDSNVHIGYLAGYGYDTVNATQAGDQNCFVGGYSHSSGTNTTQENCFGYGITGKGNSTTILRGNAYNTANSSSFSTSSDRRIKKNIVDNNVGLDIIDKIQIRNFEYRTQDEITDFDNPASAVVEEEGTQIGVIAQELEEICSSCVSIESTGVKSVDPDNITWYLVNAVKELSAEVKSLKAQLNS